MLKEQRFEELGRENIFEEYLRLKYAGSDMKEEGLLPEAIERMEKNKEYFKGKTKCEVLIKGDIKFSKDFVKMFTFLNKVYDIGDESVKNLAEKSERYEAILYDLDEFNAFMKGSPINYYSEIEHEYINYERVMNAKIFIELT